MVDQKGRPQSEQQTDHARERSRSQRLRLDGFVGEVRRLHDGSAAGREGGVDLQLIEALLERRPLGDERGALAVIGCLDLSLQVIQSVLELCPCGFEAVDSLLPPSGGVRLDIAVGEDLSGAGVLAPAR